LSASELRRCSDCKQEKPLGEFNRNRSRRGGREYICRSCKHDRDKAYRAATPEKQNARQQRWAAGSQERQAAIHQRYNDGHRDERREQDRVRHSRLREAILNHYGRACSCCGSSDDLGIDHIHGGGGRHRAEIGLGSSKLYRWLIASGFPGGFQILCFPCNRSKGEGDRCRLDHGTEAAE
jgi:hypothetical protein